MTASVMPARAAGGVSLAMIAAPFGEIRPPELAASLFCFASRVNQFTFARRQTCYRTVGGFQGPRIGRRRDRIFRARRRSFFEGRLPPLGIPRNHFSRCMKLRGNEPRQPARRFKKGISKMIMLKIAAAIVAVAIAGSLLVVLAPDFSADLALATVALFG
jgi:hypothetical protein